MNRNKKRLIAIVCIILIVAAAVLGILIYKGFRFSSKSAMGSQTGEYDHKIHTKDYDFYYTALDFTDADGNFNETIRQVMPVKKYAFLYKKTDTPELKNVVIQKSQNSAGQFISFKCNNCYYNFYIMPFYSLPLEFISLGNRAYSYENVVVSGEVIPITSLSYFITDEKVTQFEIEGIVLEVVE